MNRCAHLRSSPKRLISIIVRPIKVCGSLGGTNKTRFYYKYPTRPGNLYFRYWNRGKPQALFKDSCPSPLSLGQWVSGRQGVVDKGPPVRRRNENVILSLLSLSVRPGMIKRKDVWDHTQDRLRTAHDNPFCSSPLKKTTLLPRRGRKVSSPVGEGEQVLGVPKGSEGGSGSVVTWQ